MTEPLTPEMVRAAMEIIGGDFAAGQSPRVFAAWQAMRVVAGESDAVRAPDAAARLRTVATFLRQRSLNQAATECDLAAEEIDQLRADMASLVRISAESFDAIVRAAQKRKP